LSFTALLTLTTAIITRETMTAVRRAVTRCTIAAAPGEADAV